MVKLSLTSGELSDSDYVAILASQASQGDTAAINAIDEYVDCIRHDGRSFDLEFFLSAIPGLRDRPVVLDTAIEYALKDLQDHDMTFREAIELLQGNYPDLVDQISTASVLSALLCETAGVRVAFENNDPPLDLGPTEEDGHPRYHLLERCGAGSSSTIYKATDRRLTDDFGNTTVAIKLMSVSNFSGDEKHAVLAEANRAGSVNHPNVVRVFDRGVTTCDWAYVAMEHTSLGALDKWIPSDLASLVRCIRDVAWGLHAIHSVGIVHADIKPANILLFGNKEAPDQVVPKITDFGISRIQPPGLDVLLRHDTSDRKYGNLAFMAPEVFEGTAQHSIQADVYSLAAMLHYMASGELVHANRVEGTALSHRTDSARCVPGRLCRIISLAMNSDNMIRTSSAAEFADNLDAWLKKKPIARLDNSASVLRLWTLRHPAMAAASLLLVVAAPPIGVGYANARDGWAFQRGREEARADTLAWYRAAEPAFSDRSSVYDLAGRLVVHQLIQNEDALSWVFNEELTLEDRIAALKTDMASVQPNSLDGMLIREQIILHELQSKLYFKDTSLLILDQEKALNDAGLLFGNDIEQLQVFRSIEAIKNAVIARANGEDWRADQLETHLKYLAVFLESRTDDATKMLDSDAKRDPRIRLAARAAEWASSPKILDEPEFNLWIRDEYR